MVEGAEAYATACAVHLEPMGRALRLHGAVARDASLRERHRIPRLSAPDSTAWSVIKGAGAGEQGARERFAAAYGVVIRAYLSARWRLPQEHQEIDDGTQEVFVQCFKPGGALQGVDPSGPARFRTYLYAIVRHVAERIERSNGRRRLAQEPSAGLDELELAEATLSRVFDRAWVGMITRRAWLLMAARSEEGGRDRIQILDLRFREGLQSGEIAARLHLDPGYVYQQLRNAKRDFRAALVEVVGSYHPGASREEIEARCVDLTGLL
jgi:RNA polymerase sigma factor (sigma-70 family)